MMSVICYPAMCSFVLEIISVIYYVSEILCEVILSTHRFDSLHNHVFLRVFNKITQNFLCECHLLKNNMLVSRAPYP